MRPARWLSTLQCQNYILADQVSIFQLVAEKAAVKTVQAIYPKEHSKINKKKFILRRWQGGKKGDRETF